MSAHIMRHTLCAFVAFVLILSAPAVALGAPTNSKIQAAKKEAAEARERLDELAADLEERSEEHLAINEELTLTRARIRTAEEELHAAEVELASAEKQLNERALSIYRNGGVDIISVMLGVTGFRDFVTRLELLRRVSAHDAALVSSVKVARSQAERTRHSLENRRSEQLVLARRAAEKQRDVERALESQRSYLAGVDSTLEKLIAEERERQERLARERAAAESAELARKARVAAERAAAQVSADRPAEAAAGATGATAGGTGAGPLPAGHGRALAVARSFVGATPYVWGGVTPKGFDCSGLTMYCYREVGINLPRTSRQQYYAGARIPAERLDLLEPGDLVFFARDADPTRIHHVGIYSGSGNYVHAPQAGELVSESSLLGRIVTRGDYVGAVRP